MNPRVKPGSRLGVALLIGAVGVVMGVAAGCGDDQESVAAADRPYTSHHADRASPQIHTDRGHAFQDDMRKLWEDHVTWTRLAIVSFVDDLPDLKPTVARLLQNQTDIGGAIKPYYGEQAGDQLTRLLNGHINGAVELLSAAKRNDGPKVEQASTAWYRNGNQIADFLSNANPDHWPRAEMRRMMKTHLDQTLDEATQRLEGKHRAEIRSYDEIHEHILEMADALSDGIEAQFPERFE